MNNLLLLSPQEIYIIMHLGMQHQKMYHLHIKTIIEQHHLFYSDKELYFKITYIKIQLKKKLIKKIYNH